MEESFLGYDRAIDVLKLSLQVFQEEVIQRIASLRKRRNATTPFQTLPSELRTEIFLHATQENPNPTRRAAELATVSSQWWHVIVNSAPLWSFIQTSCRGRMVVLERSKNRPINVIIDSDRLDNFKDGTAQFLQTLETQTHRWRTLRVTSNDIYSLHISRDTSIPLLESIKFDGSRAVRPSIPFHGGLRLREIQLQGAAISFVNTVVSKLETLSIKGIQVQDSDCASGLRNALGRCRQLKVLRLQDITVYASEGPLHFTAPSYSTQLRLPSLEELHVAVVCSEVTYALFPGLEADNLTKLRLHVGCEEEEGESVFEALATNGEQSLLNGVMRRWGDDDVVLGIYQDKIAVRDHDNHRYPIPESSKLSIHIPVENYEEKFSQVLSLLDPSKPVTVVFEESFTSMDLQGMEMPDFLINIPGVTRLIINDFQSAVTLLQFLSSPVDTYDPTSYPCPGLQLVRLQTKFRYGARGHVLVGLIEDMRTLRPKVQVVDVIPS